MNIKIIGIVPQAGTSLQLALCYKKDNKTLSNKILKI